MRQWQSILVWACATAVVALPGLALAQVQYDVDPKKSTDGTPVPDVDKLGVPPAPAGDDMGCWAATASNILGASGWGIAGTAQQKGNQIYQDFINNFKLAPGDQYLKATGSCFAASQWWVNNIGLNAAKAGAGYSPATTYVNFRVKEMTL